MDYSFYGGRRGAAFVIAGRFTSIKEMITNFNQGSNYSVINYDEYVIIDTMNKNDPDNGKIFRRGYNYQDELGGAQYIGQIVGPSGLAPKVEMTTLDVVKNMQEQEGFEYRHSEGEYAPLTNLVPGKDGESFNDAIKWACCSVRDENNKDTTAYVGFTFPYTVIEYAADSVDPYYHRNNDTADFVNENLVDREDDATHPFYEKWHISVPKGIKGNALKNFRIISASNNDDIQPYGQQLEDRAGKTVHTFEGEDTTRKIAVYDYYDYSRDPNGEPVSLCLGDYNMISDVAFDDDGTVRISYTHDDDSVWENKFKWVTDISITQQGVFTINYNYGGETTKYQTTLAWIDKVDFADDGTIKFIYNDGITKDIEFPNKIQWVTGVVLAEDGTLTFSYNNGTEDTVFQKAVKWITDVQFDEQGTLQVSYNNGTPTSVWENYVKWITNIQMADDGTVTISYNNNTPDSKWDNLIKWITGVNLSENGTLSISYNNKTPNDDFPKMIKWISNILLADDGTLTMQYNNEDPDTNFTKKIKWIENTTLTEDGTLSVHYNNGDPDDTWKNTLKWITNVELNPDGTFTISYNTGDPSVWDKTIRWITETSLGNDGKFVMRFNDGTPAIEKTFRWIINCTFTDTGDFTLEFNDGTPAVTQHIKWINDIRINTGAQEGEGNQKLHVTYNDEEKDIGEALNYIMKMVVTPDNYHLLILYSDPARRQAIVTAGMNATYEGRDDWYDCGSVRDYDGILIGTNYELNHFTDTSVLGIITQLNKELPNGFADDDAKRYGRVVTVGNENTNKLFFGFDYSIKTTGGYEGWYYLGSFGEHPGVVAGRVDDPIAQAAAKMLPTGSVWLVLQ